MNQGNSTAAAPTKTRKMAAARGAVTLAQRQTAPVQGIVSSTAVDRHGVAVGASVLLAPFMVRRVEAIVPRDAWGQLRNGLDARTLSLVAAR